MLKRIKLDRIERNPDQPRQHFDERALSDLAASIRQNGLQQPITVRPIADGRFMVVAGERRFRAHLLMAETGDATDILAHVRKMDDETMHMQAILENLQREDVSPIEEAIAYERAVTLYGITIEELARRLGISRVRQISERIQLLGLTADMRGLLAQRIITPTQGWHMARLSPNGQTRMLGLVKRGLCRTQAAAAAVADQIEAEEAQTGFDMPEVTRKVASLASTEDRIDRLGVAVQPFFKDGNYTAPDGIDPGEGRRCIEKLQLIRKALGQIERELERVTSTSSVSEAA